MASEQQDQERLIAMLESDPRTLIGKTVKAVEVGGIVEAHYERAEELCLTFSDGTKARIGYWFSYADDAGLEVEIVEAGEGGEHGGA